MQSVHIWLFCAVCFKKKKKKSSVCHSVFHFQFCYNFSTELSIVGWPSNQPGSTCWPHFWSRVHFYHFFVKKYYFFFCCKWNESTINPICNHSTVFMAIFFFLPPPFNSGQCLGSRHRRSRCCLTHGARCGARAATHVVTEGFYRQPVALTGKANGRAAPLLARPSVCSSQGLSWATGASGTPRPPRHPPTHPHQLPLPTRPTRPEWSKGEKTFQIPATNFWEGLNPSSHSNRNESHVFHKVLKKNILLARLLPNKTKMLTCVSMTDESHDHTSHTHTLVPVTGDQSKDCCEFSLSPCWVWGWTHSANTHRCELIVCCRFNLYMYIYIFIHTCILYTSPLTEAPTALGIHRCQMERSADDNSLRVFWVNSSVLLPESERRPGESRAEGTAFTLLQEGDARVSGALEHSGGSAAAAAAELLLRCAQSARRQHATCTPHEVVLLLLQQQRGVVFFFLR